MSDARKYPEVTFPQKSASNHWSLKKIVEDVTGKKLEEMQDKPSKPRKVQKEVCGEREEIRSEEREPEAPTLPQFLPQEKKPIFATLPPDMLENVPFVNEERLESGHVSKKELERKYLAYLMMHMESLTDPALRYLRQAVEEECRDRNLH